MAQPKHHSVEEAIDRAVDERAERAFAFLEELVREPSVPGAEQGAEDVLAAELDRIGMAVERIPFPDGIDRHADLQRFLGGPAGRDHTGTTPRRVDYP